MFSVMTFENKYLKIKNLCIINLMKNYSVNDTLNLFMGSLPSKNFSNILDYEYNSKFFTPYSYDMYYGINSHIDCRNFKNPKYTKHSISLSNFKMKFLIIESYYMIININKK